MKKIFVLMLVVCLFGCVTMSAVSEVPELALQLNGHVWVQMDGMTQVVFLFGFAAGQCEMAIHLDELDAWEELCDMQLSFKEVAEQITQYYIATGRLDDSILMVFRMIANLTLEKNTAVPIPGGV